MIEPAQSPHRLTDTCFRPESLAALVIERLHVWDKESLVHWTLFFGTYAELYEKFKDKSGRTHGIAREAELYLQEQLLIKFSNDVSLLNISQLTCPTASGSLGLLLKQCDHAACLCLPLLHISSRSDKTT